MKKTNRGKPGSFLFILILGLLTAIGPLSIDMYLPAFPDIATGLGSSIDRVMLSLSSFFIGISIGQLIYGPLLERFGRKKPMYAGLSIYLIASAGCALSNSVNMLIALRFLQALGGCAGMVAARAIVRDLFEVRQSAKVFSTLMLVVAVSPIVAPTLGGYLTSLAGWRYVFVALAIINLLILAGVYFILPETRSPDPNFSLKAGKVIGDFTGVMRHPQFYTYALTGAISFAGLYAYISGSPFVFMDLHQVNEKQFGWIFAIIALGIIGASQANNLALRKYHSEQIIRMACAFQSLIGLTLVLMVLFHADGLVMTITLIFLFLFGQGFIFPNASALSLAPFGKNAGTASALLGAIQMSIGAGASALVSWLQGRSALAMAAVMFAAAVGAFLVVVLGKRIIASRASLKATMEEEVEMIGGF